ncbi:MAG: type IV secretory system conjugative DNA transfer family protein [Candidatus Thiodiazotropha sp. (ex Codakia orbicularis)]|nr:type IV secretory system conjugative DNA transfer family protein [Candidatus Thiodiazotropha sp. (ex Codakia orbicularis)]
MSTQRKTPMGMTGRAVIIFLLLLVLDWSGPVTVNEEIQPLSAALIGILLLGIGAFLADFFRLLAVILEWFGTHLPTGKDGTARWARWKDLKGELNRKLQGPFWSLLAGRSAKPLFIDYVSNAMTLAPAGSGKGICTVIPDLFAIKESKVIGDFKGELLCVMKAPLETMGHTVRFLNPGGLWKEIAGEGDSYNPLDIIVDDLHRPGGLRDVPDDLRELTAQILPEPAETDGENTYWREGSRRIMADAILLEAMVEEYDATLSSVALLIEDREALEHNLRWLVGIDIEGKPLPDGPMPIEQAEWARKHDPEDVAEFIQLVRARATNLLALMGNGESRTFDSFVSGAQQALAPFAFGRLAPAMRRSTFSMNNLKEGDQATNLFIVADASRPEVYKNYIGLIQWCAMTAIKRHPDKGRPVYFIMDEATNYKVHGLESLLTWGRSYGLRLHLIFQDLSAFERVYGKTALETLLSETEIKQFLPGQRSPKTLEMISKMLGDQSVMAASLSQRDGDVHEQMSEAARPLMTPDEIRRSSYGLLLVRRAPPALIEPVSYAEIHPWRKQAGINPFHGKPFLRKVRLKLR